MEKTNYVETYAYYCATRALMEQAGFVFQYQFATEGEREAYEQALANPGGCRSKLYTEGYQIYTSFDLQLQEELQAAVDDTLSGFTEKMTRVFMICRGRQSALTTITATCARWWAAGSRILTDTR